MSFDLSETMAPALRSSPSVRARPPSGSEPVDAKWNRSLARRVSAVLGWPSRKGRGTVSGIGGCCRVRRVGRRVQLPRHPFRGTSPSKGPFRSLMPWDGQASYRILPPFPQVVLGGLVPRVASPRVLCALQSPLKFSGRRKVCFSASGRPGRSLLYSIRPLSAQGFGCSQQMAVSSAFP